MKRLSFVLLIMAGIAAFSAAQTLGSEPFRQEGIASWYGAEFNGRPTASGEIFNDGLFTAAHPTLPFGTILLITNKQNMRRVAVRVNDRGPFVAARIIDLSRAAAEVLDMLATGTAPVIVERALSAAPGPAGIQAPAPDSAATAVSPALSEMTQVITQPAPATAPAAFPPAAQLPSWTTPAESPAAAQPVPVTARMAVGPAPAEIKGGIPAAGSTKLYRLQVGAYIVPRNAMDTFDKLKSAGLNPAYERNGDYYRVVLAGLRAGEIESISQKLGNAGFREAIIREEN